MYNLAIGRFLLLFLFDVIFRKADSCPYTSERYKDLCYWLAGTGDINQCQSSCEINGGSLAVVPDSDAQQFLKDKFLGGTSDSESDSLWIGVNDIIAEDVFKDTEGNNQTYFYWRSGQPNDDTMGTDQDCVAMFGGVENFEWQDKECYSVRHCLCFSSLTRIRIFYKIVDNAALTGCSQSIAPTRSKVECLVICVGQPGCSSVNYNDVTRFCELNLCNANGTVESRTDYAYWKQMIM